MTVEKLTQAQLDRASKEALKGLILPSGARLVALRALSNTFTPLKDKEKKDGRKK